MSGKRVTFEQLVARRAQREADKLKVGAVAVPGCGECLEMRMPPKAAVLELYGEFYAANDAKDMLLCCAHALYACCPQLQDRALHEELGVEAEPMRVIDALFSVPEQDTMGGEVLRFLGFLRKEPEGQADAPGEKSPEEPGLDAVKN